MASHCPPSCSRFMLIDDNEFLSLYPFESMPPLFINKQTSVITVGEDLESVPRAYGSEIFAIAGLVTLKSYSFLVTVSSANVVGTVLGHDIWLATSFSVIPLTSSSKSDFLSSQRLVSTTPQLFPSPALSLPLSTTPQSQTKISCHVISGPKLTPTSASTLSLRVLSLPPPQHRSYVMPLTQGFVSIAYRIIPYTHTPLHYLLFSRRDASNVGKRFTRRGLNPDFSTSCSNSVVTEQVVLSDDEVKSVFTLVRGSIPLKWSQMANLSIKPGIKILADHENNLNILKNSMERLINSFGGPVIIINLLDDHGNEKEISQLYGDLITLVNLPIHYHHFNFHKECANFKYENVFDLIHSIESELDSVTFTSQSSTQSGVVRVNCIDCLDRTNVVQSSLCRFLLHKQLSQLGCSCVSLPKLPPQMAPSDVQSLGMIAFEKKLEEVFRRIWGDHGDELAVQYTGTFAMKRDFTFKGKRSLFGAIEDGYCALSRFFQNNFHHGLVQDALDVVLKGHDAGSLLDRMLEYERRSKLRKYLLMFILSIFVLGLFKGRSGLVVVCIFLVFLKFFFKKVAKRFTIAPFVCKFSLNYYLDIKNI
ncbi:hypothetical protein GEMRC1_011161 [Eukaryota sp. GEM-RC1]